MPYDNLTTVASLKAWMKPTAGGSDDAELATLINVASDLIGRFCGRDNLGKVYQYTENYFRSGAMRTGTRVDLSLVLRHYPITQMVSVFSGNTQIPVLAQADLQSNQAGVFVQEDVEPRMLKFRFVSLPYPITVTYMAGYSFNSIPQTLGQACNQVAAEIFRSASWIGKKSQAMAGETTTYDSGEAWGMSKRTQAMLSQYKDVVPFRYF